ncbi:hypothetical protein ACFPH6_24605 [Streptomyces xiangluensis]|uniref:Uncharacterized protein n=1 Tax=Streptomyces xiangluensis TaxID=2665720 RepID=A0ABV8YSX7_9ACTN
MALFGEREAAIMDEVWAETHRCACAAERPGEPAGSPTGTA